MHTVRLPNQSYALPVSLDNLVQHLRLADAATDVAAAELGKVSDYAKAAAQLYETVTRQAVMEANYVSVVDGWSEQVSGLVGPVRAVSRVSYRDGANTVTDLLDTDYELSELDSSALLFPNRSMWPRLYPGAVEPIRIYYSAGAETPEQVAPLTQQFIKLMVAHWYENPQAAVVAASVQELPLGAQEILRWEREPIL